MGVFSKYVHRHRTEDERLTANLIAASNCISSISDLCTKSARVSARDNLRATKKPDCNRTNFKHKKINF